MTDHHFMYNSLIDKVDALLDENSKLRSRIYQRIGHSPLQISERKDMREELVRDTSKKFHVVMRFFRDFIERTYTSRMVPFHSYAGLIEAHDLLERFMGNILAPITMEALLAISITWERIMIRNLFRMYIFDQRDNPDVELEKLVILICALEEAKRYQEGKGNWSSDIMSLSKFYQDEFSTIEISDLDETDSILETIRDDDNHMWYLNSVVFPIMLQKYENKVFDFEDKKPDSWKEIWERLNELPGLDGRPKPKYTLENPETLKFIIKNALMHYHVGSLHLYHPMWIFGRMHYWNVLHTYLHDFQLEFENMQLQRMMEEV